MCSSSTGRCDRDLVYLFFFLLSPSFYSLRFCFCCFFFFFSFSAMHLIRARRCVHRLAYSPNTKHIYPHNSALKQYKYCLLGELYVWVIVPKDVMPSALFLFAFHLAYAPRIHAHQSRKRMLCACVALVFISIESRRDLRVSVCIATKVYRFFTCFFLPEQLLRLELSLCAVRTQAWARTHANRQVTIGEWTYSIRTSFHVFFLLFCSSYAGSFYTLVIGVTPLQPESFDRCCSRVLKTLVHFSFFFVCDPLWLRWLLLPLLLLWNCVTITSTIVSNDEAQHGAWCMLYLSP